MGKKTWVRDVAKRRELLLSAGEIGGVFRSMGFEDESDKFVNILRSLLSDAPDLGLVGPLYVETVVRGLINDWESGAPGCASSQPFGVDGDVMRDVVGAIRDQKTEPDELMKKLLDGRERNAVYDLCIFALYWSRLLAGSPFAVDEKSRAGGGRNFRKKIMYAFQMVARSILFSLLNLVAYGVIRKVGAVANISQSALGDVMMNATSFIVSIFVWMAFVES